MRKIAKTLLVILITGIAILSSCTDNSCPDDMVECDDGQGGTFCAPKSVGC